MRYEYDGEESFGIHEYYERESGSCWTETPVDVVGSSVDDLRWTLEEMLKSLDIHGVIDYDSIDDLDFEGE